MIIKKITDVLGTKVYTDSGDFFGEIEEANLQENKIDGWNPGHGLRPDFQYLPVLPSIMACQVLCWLWSGTKKPSCWPAQSI